MHQPTTFTVDGDAIRKERKQAGLEINELAKLAGISPRYLCHLENGTRERMRPRRYAALRTALKTTDERLLAPQRTNTPKEHPDG